MAHFSRKCYSTVKQQLQDDAGYSPLILSEMDTVFMGTYAAGNIISGKLGDTFNPTTVLAIGLFGSGTCLFLINISLWFDFLSFSMTLGNFFIIAVYFMFGFFQSTGGPVGKFYVWLFFQFTSHHDFCSSSYLTLLLLDYAIQELLSWATGSVTRNPSKTVGLSLVSGRATNTVVMLLLLFVLPSSLEWELTTLGPSSSPL